jgi:pyruvate,water dikinase
MIQLHQKYTATSVVVTGLLLADAVPWTGATVGEVCNLLKGSSPISNGFAADELVKAGGALAAHAGGKALLHSSASPAQKLEALSTDPDVGPAVRAYIEAVQFRTVGYDVGDPMAGEMPQLLLQALETAVDGTRPLSSDRAMADDLRSRVPAEHRAEFDELLAEARLVNRLRDERGAYSDGWATGLARRALLEVGRRLHERGLLLDPEHAVDLRLDELADEVPGRCRPALRLQLLPVREDLQRRGGAERQQSVFLAVLGADQHVGELGVGVPDQAVAPRRHPRVVLVRDGEQPR